jgi:hypothetical protein
MAANFFLDHIYEYYDIKYQEKSLNIIKILITKMSQFFGFYKTKLYHIVRIWEFSKVWIALEYTSAWYLRHLKHWNESSSGDSFLISLRSKLLVQQTSFLHWDLKIDSKIYWKAHASFILNLCSRIRYP